MSILKRVTLITAASLIAVAIMGTLWFVSADTAEAASESAAAPAVTAEMKKAATPAVVQGITLKVTGRNKIVVSWKPQAKAVSYRVYWRKAGSKSYGRRTVGSRVRSTTLTVAYKTRYIVYVRAVGRYSTISPCSAGKSAATLSKPAPAPSRYEKGLAAYIRKVNRNVSAANARSMAASFVYWGKKYKVRPEILMGMAQCESTFYHRAKNPAGYYGLMQTSALLGRKYAKVSPSQLLNAHHSIHTGAAYLRANMNAFGNNYVKAISGYCYGTGAVRRGRYSASYANRRIRIANNITAFLKRNKYI